MRISAILPLILLFSCHQVPSERLSQWKLGIDYTVENDSLRIEVDNALHCPLRIRAKSDHDSIQSILDRDFPFILPPKLDTVFTYWTSLSKEDIPISFSATMGDPEDEITLQELELPFPKDKQYKIVQAYNGKFSHRSAYSKYALDFNLMEGDTVCAAADGFVVGVIEGYKHGGNSKKWRPYANFITIFHPEMNVYTQYVHLMHEGSFVEVGDSVASGQAIGLSGETGFTSTAHLHFNVLVASETGMESTPSEFREGYKGSQLREGDVVKKER